MISDLSKTSSQAISFTDDEGPPTLTSHLVILRPISGSRVSFGHCRERGRALQALRISSCYFGVADTIKAHLVKVPALFVSELCMEKLNGTSVTLDNVTPLWDVLMERIDSGSLVGLGCRVCVGDGLDLQ